MTIYTFQDGQIIEVPNALGDFSYYINEILKREFEEMSSFNPNADEDWIDITSPDWWRSEKATPADKDPMVWMGTYWKIPSTFDTNTGLLSQANWARKRVYTALRFTISTTSTGINLRIYDNTGSSTTYSYYNSLAVISLNYETYFRSVTAFKLAFSGTQDLNLKILKIEAIFTERQRKKYTIVEYPELNYHSINYLATGQYQDGSISFAGAFSNDVTMDNIAAFYHYINNNWEIQDLSELPTDMYNPSGSGVNIWTSGNKETPSILLQYIHENNNGYCLSYYPKQNGIWTQEKIYQGTSYNRSRPQDVMFKMSNGEYKLLCFDSYIYVNKFWMYTRAINGTWSAQNIYSIGGPYLYGYFKMLVDSNDKIYIFYSNQDTKITYCLTNYSGSWVTSSVYTMPSLFIHGWDACLVDNIPHFLYQDKGLHYRKFVSGTWQSAVKFYNDYQRGFYCFYNPTSNRLCLLFEEASTPRMFYQFCGFNKSTYVLEELKLIDSFIYGLDGYGVNAGFFLNPPSFIDYVYGTGDYSGSYERDRYRIKPVKITLVE